MITNKQYLKTSEGMADLDETKDVYVTCSKCGKKVNLADMRYPHETQEKLFDAFDPRTETKPEDVDLEGKPFLCPDCMLIYEIQK